MVLRARVGSPCQAIENAKNWVRVMSQSGIGKAELAARQALDALEARAGGGVAGKSWAADLPGDAAWPAVLHAAAYHFSKEGRDAHRTGARRVDQGI